MFKYWSSLAMLAAESQQVIFLRMMKLAAGGPGAHAEANRMVSEKVGQAGRAMTRLALGGSPASVMGGYRKAVRANRRRLSK